jgi:hypothetical protein
MANTRRRATPPPVSPASSTGDAEATALSAVDSRLSAYAETLGSTLGQLRNTVDSWKGQRTQLVDRLSTLVSEAQGLLADLGHTAGAGITRLRGRRRPKKFAVPASNPAGALKKAKREKGITESRRAAMSAETKPRPTRYPSARAANK